MNIYATKREKLYDTYHTGLKYSISMCFPKWHFLPLAKADNVIQLSPDSNLQKLLKCHSVFNQALEISSAALLPLFKNVLKSYDVHLHQECKYFARYWIIRVSKSEVLQVKYFHKQLRKQGPKFYFTIDIQVTESHWKSVGPRFLTACQNM